MEITESEKEKTIYETVCTVEKDMLVVIETCQPDELSASEYFTCVTLSLAYVIEGLANMGSQLKGHDMSFENLMTHIQAAHEKSLKYRVKKNGNK